MRDNSEGRFPVELRYAESVKIRLQQLETSVNVANRGQFNDTATRIRQSRSLAVLGTSVIDYTASS